ncbi:MAG: PH domain-containing protein [Oscillospiraceae bacterium]
MKRYLADRNSLNIIRLIILALMITLILLAHYYLIFLPWLMWIIITLCAVCGIFFASVYLPLFYRSAGYYISSEQIIKKTGVFIKNNQHMKMSAVQYATFITTPFSKFTGFNFIVFHAFGGNLVLMFLSRSDINSINALWHSISEKKDIQG